VKFKFRLEKTASFLLKKEKAKQLEVVQVLNDLEEIRQKRIRIENENGEVFRENSQPQEIKAAWLKVLFDRVEFNLHEIDALAEKTTERKVVLEEKKTELVAIAQRRKALEKLKEKKLFEFKVLQARKDQKMLDENYQILELIKK